MGPLRKDTFHPSFIIGAFSFLLLVSGVVFRKYDFPAGDYVILSGLIFGAVHWVWSSIDVFTNKDLDPPSRMFWMILVLLIPPVGGMVYYLMQSKNVRL